MFNKKKNVAKQIQQLQKRLELLQKEQQRITDELDNLSQQCEEESTSESETDHDENANQDEATASPRDEVITENSQDIKPEENSPSEENSQPEENSPSETEPENETTDNVIDLPSDANYYLLKDINERLIKIDERIKKVEYNDKIIKDLHEELQSHKDDLYKKITSPFLKELILWADKVRNTISFYDKECSGEDLKEMYDKLKKEYSKLCGQVEDILYDFDIEPYTTAVGEAVDTKKHNILMVINTNKEELDKTIAASIRVGYISETKVMRREDVKAYIFKG